MKKQISKMLVATMSLSLLLSVVACRPNGGKGEKIDEGKTQLYVNVLECGVGNQFLTSLKSKFESAYANESFEAGKQGVQLMMRQAQVDDAQLTSALASPDVDIYYVVNVDFTKFINLTNGTSEYFEDITDIVIEGGEKSIHNSIYENYRKAYNVGTETAPKYFVLPWYSSYFGTVYDVGLFKEKHLYSNDPESAIVYKGLDGIVQTEDDNWGPDGLPDTFDDGLPATWSDFDELLAEMKTQGITPFVFTEYADYANGWLGSLWASYEGKDNFQLSSNFDGTYTYTDENGEIATKQISFENGYEVATQNGAKAAVSIAEKIIREKLFYEESLYSGTDHLKAQKLYLGSKAGLNPDGKPIAFLMEGSWWENEAKDYFAEIAARKGSEYAYGTREFAMLPFPKFTESTEFVPKQVNTKITLKSNSVRRYVNGVLVNKKSDQKDLAKLFLKFAYSEEMNADFNINSGLTRPMTYTMKPEQLQQLTPYQRSIYELTQNENVEIVTSSCEKAVMRTQMSLIADINSFKSKMGTSEKTLVFSAFYTDNKITKESYWSGMLNSDVKSRWLAVNWNL